jgi:hypothetical protein
MVAVKEIKQERCQQIAIYAVKLENICNNNNNNLEAERTVKCKS